MRLFIAIPLSPAVLAELSTVVARLRSSSDGLRWMAPESWHITLQFLGNTDPDKYNCLVSRLGEVRSAPVPVHLTQLGFFDRAGIFYADVRLTAEIVALAERITLATAVCGFVPEVRPFHPHITLARAKEQGRGQPLRILERRILRQPSFTRFVAPEFLLYESHPSADGASYEIRCRFPLHTHA
ncbi:MAG TPA: RNA 2',3'-cyclic phosphodiesterase [Terracidiphilus sp.]|nr:RNA 2',3'-cyclic phosphodiesterase [Terracidiphilus sp.]